MLDIEFIPINDSNESIIVVNGNSEKNLYENRRYHKFETRKVYDDLISNSANLISEYFDEIVYYDFDASLGLEVATFIHLNHSTFSINLNYSFDLNLWDKGFTFEKLIALLEELVPENYKSINLPNLIDSENVLGLTKEFSYSSDLLKAQVEDFTNEISTLIKSCYYSLEINNRDTFTSIFRFPESIKVSCQQYLMYFGQFLNDLGIEVETGLQEQTYSTLFSVTPKDKTEALDKIKEALEVYMNLPGLADNNLYQVNNNDMAFVQFHANVMHLKSQMMFANAAIQMKDATIESLKLSIYQLQQLHGSNSNQNSEEESIIPEILSVKKYDGKWFSVNIPEILRKLKRLSK